MPGVRRPKKGKVKLSTVTPAETGITTATVWPSSFGAAGRSKTSSRTPTQAIAIAPIEDRVALGVAGQPDQAGDEGARRGSRGRRASASAPCAASARSGSRSRRRGRASRFVSGTSEQRQRRPATRKAKRASRLVGSAGIAVEPEGKRHQAPDLAAEVLAARAVAVEDRRDGGGVEQALAGERRGARTSRAKGSQRAAQPGGDRDREALLAAVDDLLAAAAAPAPGAAAASWRSRAPSAGVGSEKANSATSWSRKGTRSSSEWAMLSGRS